MHSTTSDDSRPTTRITTKLRAARHRRRLLAILGFLLAIPLCALPPLFLGSIFWFASGQLFGYWTHWSYFFWGTALITLPLLFRFQLREGGTHLLSAARGANLNIDDAIQTGRIAATGPADHALALVAVAANPRLHVAGYIELFLAGPRLILTGLRTLRESSALPRDQLNRAAEVLTALLARETGLALDDVRHRGESDADLLPPLLWLANSGYIGVTEAHDRVYLYPHARAAFA